MNAMTTKNGNKTALITGANAGIGREVSRQLAAGGEFSKVYLACRNKDKALVANNPKNTPYISAVNGQVLRRDQITLLSSPRGRAFGYRNFKNWGHLES